MALACGAFLASSVAVSAWAEESIRAELTQQLENVNLGIDCLGAASRAPDGTSCVNPDLATTLIPSPDLVSRDNPTFLLPANCQGTKASDSVPKPCNLTSSTSETKIALIGDSHSAQYMAAMMNLANKNDWQVVSFSKGGCPLSYSERTHDAVLKDACKRWVANAFETLKNDKFKLVVTSQVSGMIWDSGSQNQEEYAEAGLVSLWQSLNESGVPVLAIRDNPRPIKDAITCISENRFSSLDRCSNPRTKAVLFDPQVGAVKKVNSQMTRLIDFTDVFCDANKCDAVIGGVIVERDKNHITNTFAITLAPYLEEQIQQLLAIK
jgi:hypothetical protein